MRLVLWAVSFFFKKHLSKNQTFFSADFRKRMEMRLRVGIWLSGHIWPTPCEGDADRHRRGGGWRISPRIAAGDGECAVGTGVRWKTSLHTHLALLMSCFASYFFSPLRICRLRIWIVALCMCVFMCLYVCEGVCVCVRARSLSLSLSPSLSHFLSLFLFFCLSHCVCVCSCVCTCVKVCACVCARAPSRSLSHPLSRIFCLSFSSSVSLLRTYTYTHELSRSCIFCLFLFISHTRALSFPPFLPRSLALIHALAFSRRMN